MYSIKNARLVDGSSINLLIENGKIKEINPSNTKGIKEIILDDDCYLSAGWIDAHTHSFKKFAMYGDEPDTIGYPTGVTTVVDAGTAGADIIDEFYETTKRYKTNVYAFINICKKGIFAQNELEDLTNLDVSLVQQMCKKYPEFIVGVKARMSKSVVGSAGDKPLGIALEAANAVDLPLMIHIGTAPSTLETVVENARPKDIITHIFNPKENGIKDAKGNIKSCVLEAVNKNIYLDIAHGSDSFSFDVLALANKNNIMADVISTDIYERNRVNGPVYDMATTMTKFLYGGYSLQRIIDCVTVNPAKMLNIPNIGEIKVGYQADFTIFKMVKGNKELVDSTGKTVIAKEYFKPVAVILKDEYIRL